MQPLIMDLIVREIRDGMKVSSCLANLCFLLCNVVALGKVSAAAAAPAVAAPAAPAAASRSAAYRC